MDNVATETLRTPTKFVIRKIKADDVYQALGEGWADFRAVPKFGLFFGGVYAVVGILIFLQLLVLDRPFWIVPVAMAFPLIGPFVAIGLYEVSRRREAGEKMDAAAILGVVWQQRDRQLPSMAVVVLGGMLFWFFAAQLIVALFLASSPGANYSNPETLLGTSTGWGILIVGTIVGAVIAGILFSITAFSLPMLLDQDVDYVTAMVTSFKAVRANQYPMINWAGTVAASLFVAMLPLFLGLIVALPILGHATWHLYRKVIAAAP